MLIAYGQLEVAAANKPLGRPALPLFLDSYALANDNNKCNKPTRQQAHLLQQDNKLVLRKTLSRPAALDRLDEQNDADDVF